jgi:uncharacterized protein YggU (UPF0235/DUF167 family)
MYIHVTVTAGARKESIKETKPNYFTISVREKPERNMANKRILELIAEHFGISASRVRITNGHRHPSKLLVIEGL